jgi:hypothetical protein
MSPHVRSTISAIVFAPLLVVSAGCKHTAQGVKTDTKNAVQTTGHGIERAGEKIESIGADKDGGK